MGIYKGTTKIDGGSVTVNQELSDTSTYAVSNKAVTNALEEVGYEMWKKPASWVDLRAGSLPNSFYFLVGHSADYTSYPEFVINAEVSNSGTYDVFVDGVKKASAVASGTATTLNWQTLALASGFDVTYPSALRTHIVRVAPTSNSNSLSRITSGAATAQNQGVLWVHSTCSNAVTIYYMLFGANYSNPLCEAFTTNQETFKTPWCEYAFAYTNLKIAPVIEMTSGGNVGGMYEGTKLKKAVFKNAQNNGGSGFSSSSYAQELQVIGGNIRAAAGLFYELANLKKIQGAISFASSDDCNNMFYKTPNVETPLFLDASDGTGVTRLTLGGSSSEKVEYIKGLVVSSSAPFDHATSPQLDISYTGLSRAALVNLFNSLPYNVGYSVVGSPTISSGVVSNFNDSNYVTIPFPTTLPAKMECVINFTTGDSITGSSNQSILNFVDFLNIEINTTGQLYTYDYTAKQRVGNVNLAPNTNYSCNILFENGHKNLALSTNGGEYTTMADFDDSTFVSHSGIVYLGKHPSNSDRYFNGSISIGTTSININDIPYFRGTVATTKTCSIVGCTGTSDLTAEDKAICTSKGWSLTLS